MIISDDFRNFFDEEELAELDEDSAVIFGLRRDFTLALLNEAWFQHARRSGATDGFFERYGLGARYLDALPELLADFFTTHVRSAMDSSRRWSFQYLCPASGVQRKFRMEVLPLDDGEGCLVTNALVVEEPHPDEVGADAGLLDAYVGDGGFITQCCHCRCTRHVDDASRWDWVPRYVDEMPELVSHGICPSCFAYFYPSNDRNRP